MGSTKPVTCYLATTSDKSCTVEWLGVSMQHARRRRLKNHKQLKELEELDPGSENVFMDNLVENHYPNRPQNLEGVCLHDFVAKYTASGKDKSGHKTYKELQKLRLVNHYVFDPQNNEDRGKYYYSLTLLFDPFRDESDLLLAGETAEEAFNRLLPTNDNCSAYHRRLQKILSLRPPLRKSTKPGRLTLKTNNPNMRKTMTLRLKVKPKQQCRTLLRCTTMLLTQSLWKSGLTCYMPTRDASLKTSRATSVNVTSIKATLMDLFLTTWAPVT